MSDFCKQLYESVLKAANRLNHATHEERIDFLKRSGYMGLGPPVCEKCRVSARYDVDIEIWVCPICSNKKCQWNAWDCGLTEEELNDNERFLRFATGQQEEDE